MVSTDVYEGKENIVRIQLVPATTPTTRPLENNSEIARLLSLHQSLSAWTGGALPPTLDTSRVRRVLDIGCGVGAWVHEVARDNPQMQVVGVDTNPYFIAHARAAAHETHNATFLEQDMHALESVFSHGSFDLIHLRFLAGTVSVAQFPLLISSVSRLCKRNGLIIVTEAELPLTSSSACDYMSSLILSAMITAGMAFSPGFTPQLGIASRLRYWLRKQNCVLKHDDTRYLDISPGKPAHNLFVRQATIFVQQVRHFVIRTGHITEEQFEELFIRMQQEIAEHSFYGVCPLHTIIAFNNVPRVGLSLVNASMPQYQYS